MNAPLSYIFGQPYANVSYDTAGSSTGNPFTTLDFDIFNEESGALLVRNSVPVNSTGSVFEFSFSSFTPREAPYQVSIYGTSPDGEQSFTSSTQVYILPARSYGSAVKIDNLFGGLYVQNAFNNWDGWYPVFQNGYYAYASYGTPSTNISFEPLDTYSAEGFNAINVVPDGSGPDSSFPPTLAQYWDRMDQLNLLNIYDMRYSYLNATQVNDQVSMWKNRSTLLMWYTGDEPDGTSIPLMRPWSHTTNLNPLIPIHPVSLVLNCQDYYYAEYASGAEIIFEDAYPVGINATWSVRWDTPCNLTYGDCGCDNCIGTLTDVSTRLDQFTNYQANIDGQGSKPNWAVLQAFGNDEYWQSTPSPAEIENMMVLAVNHNAKGITYWAYPSMDEINVGSGKLGNILKTKPAIDFLFGSNAIKSLPVDGEPLVDASAWIVGSRMMVGVASEEYVDFDSAIIITLPQVAASVEQVLYGNSTWTVLGDKLLKSGLKGLETGILVLNLAN